MTAHVVDVAGRAFQLPVPDGWTLIQPGEDGLACQRHYLRVIVSIAVQSDGNAWLHVSASRPTSIPSYLDMRDVKEAFVGPDREAYEVFPPAARYVNLHGRVRHLWCCLDQPDGVLPAFEGVVDGVRTI